MISRDQKAVLHVAKTQLGLERDDYEAILRAEAGVSSSVDLDVAGFNRVMKKFEKLGFTSTAKQQRRQKRSYKPGEPITEAQQGKIRDLYRELGWTAIERQMGFNRRCCGLSWPQTRTHGNNVIEGLKAMLARGAGTSLTSAPQQTGEGTNGEK